MYAHVESIIWFYEKLCYVGILYEFDNENKNTFKLHDGPEGHFVSVFLDLLTAQAKIIDSIDAVVYAEHELQSYISELYLFFMDQKQLTANSVLSFKKVYIQSK